MFVNLNNKVVNINHIVKIEHRNDEFGKAMLIQQANKSTKHKNPSFLVRVFYWGQ